MQSGEIQEMLLDTIPPWHFWFARPFRQLLDEGVSLPMYYCIQALRHRGDTIAMSEMAKLAHVPKQQMTKTVDRLVERGFVERVSDSADRRVIRLRLTGAAEEYVQRFLEQDAAYYRELFDSMDDAQREAFYQALTTLRSSFDFLLQTRFGGTLPPPSGGRH